MAEPASKESEMTAASKQSLSIPDWHSNAPELNRGALISMVFGAALFVGVLLLQLTFN